MWCGGVCVFVCVCVCVVLCGVVVCVRVFPKCWPDLNPLDYSIWAEANRQMLKSKKAYAARLRHTAMRLPTGFVRNAALALPKRIRQVIAHKGKNIPRDEKPALNCDSEMPG